MDIGNQERVIIVDPLEFPSEAEPVEAPMTDPADPEPAPHDQPEPADT